LNAQHCKTTNYPALNSAATITFAVRARGRFERKNQRRKKLSDREKRLAKADSFFLDQLENEKLRVVGQGIQRINTIAS
jgi:hypothetical protein